MIGILAGTTEPLAVTPILMNEVRLQGIMVGPRESLEAMVGAFEHTRLEPIVDRVFGFDEAPAAFAHLQSGAHFGKVVVTI